MNDVDTACETKRSSSEGEDPPPPPLISSKDLKGCMGFDNFFTAVEQDRALRQSFNVKNFVSGAQASSFAYKQSPMSETSSSRHPRYYSTETLAPPRKMATNLDANCQSILDHYNKLGRNYEYYQDRYDVLDDRCERFVRSRSETALRNRLNVFNGEELFNINRSELINTKIIRPDKIAILENHANLELIRHKQLSQDGQMRDELVSSRCFGAETVTDNYTGLGSDILKYEDTSLSPQQNNTRLLTTERKGPENNDNNETHSSQFSSNHPRLEISVETKAGSTPTEYDQDSNYYISDTDSSTYSVSTHKSNTDNCEKHHNERETNSDPDKLTGAESLLTLAEDFEVRSKTSSKKRGGGKVGRRRRRGYIYNPKPLVAKNKIAQLSNDAKDDDYWDRRRRNNEAAKRSRANRRIKELETVSVAKELTRKNKELKERVEQLEERNKYLENLLKDKNLDIHST